MSASGDKTGVKVQRNDIALCHECVTLLCEHEPAVCLCECMFEDICIEPEN